MTLAVLTSVVAFIVAISVLIAVHEFGHFWVARKLGFKVLRFSIGFGRPLLKRTGAAPDRTEYVLAALPLGGYVKMLDEREGPLDPADSARAFQSRPPLARIGVLLAGPGANFLFAVVAFWLLYMAGIPGLKPVVGEVTPGSIAAEAGLESGQTIVRVGSAPVATREAAMLGILDVLVDEGRVPVTLVDEAGRERSTTLFVAADKRRQLTEPGALLGPAAGVAGLAAALPPGSMPMYVSSVSYGWMALLFIETNYSKDQMDMALDVAYDAAGDLEAKMDFGYSAKNVLQTSKIQIIVYGGSTSGLTSDTLKGYSGLLELIQGSKNFGADSPAVPLSFRLRHLSNNLIAKIALTEEYTITKAVRLREFVKISINLFRCIEAYDSSGPLDMDRFNVSVTVHQGGTVIHTEQMSISFFITPATM